MTRSAVILALIGLGLSVPLSRAQDARSQGPATRVVVTKLGPLRYPQIGRTANISGDVTVELDIARDGSIQSATAISGPALLHKAALESAQQSQFACRSCSHAVTPYRLTFAFQLKPAGSGGQTTPQIRRSANRIVITAEPFVEVLAPAVPERRRSWICLYLWHCAH
jgi:Gram-negative bacterial TonB protein C-terminal